MQVLIVDAANVVGSRPDGWWRDRAGAARRLLDQLIATEVAAEDEVVLVVEGKAKAGCPAGQEGHVRTVHAPASGDDAIVEEVAGQVAAGDGRAVTVVTADRGLMSRVTEAGGTTQSPRWLLDQL
ncbi:MAG TPA: NYN domain-containing protein [Ornithinimicrobium sp.]|uniref:NYN domain-containing protein n=1 Tax=Ornithinimicrobium sp. TaxID=1977084 RepID=UPI002B464975|nr:NYN domain-containing protein [Ornithinimicrobium sp.]HKJ12396.1 NYN domain-containing protein [Ornithinimicrobium sp.]